MNPEPEPWRLNPPGGGGGNGGRNPGNGTSSPNGSGGKLNPGPGCAAFSTATTLMWTTAGEAWAVRLANEGRAWPDGVVTAAELLAEESACTRSTRVTRPRANPLRTRHTAIVPARAFFFAVIVILLRVGVSLCFDEEHSARI